MRGSQYAGDGHRAALAAATASCTVVADMISVRPARDIRNRLLDELIESGLITNPGSARVDDAAGDAGDPQSTPTFSGESAVLTWDTNAAELVQPTRGITARSLRNFP